MYDYLFEMTQLVLDYIVDNYTPESYIPSNSEIDEILNDELWADDGITGNGVLGQFFNSEEEARKVVFGNPENSKLLVEALEEFGDDVDSYKRALKDAHFADTTIRCYLLNAAIRSALDKLRD